MQVRAIDHVNLRVPEGSVEAAIEFYVDGLGFEVENLDRYRRGEKPFFSIRLADDAVLHLRPTESFEPPAGTDYDHVALVVEESIRAIERRLADAGVAVERELSEPLGATGEAPGVYVRDPFGYRIELKEPA